MSKLDSTLRIYSKPLRIELRSEFSLSLKMFVEAKAYISNNDLWLTNFLILQRQLEQSLQND